MTARFGPDGIAVSLTREEYIFLALTLGHYLWGQSVKAADFVEALGIPREEAEAFEDDLSDLELDARARGTHWLPPYPEKGRPRVESIRSASFTRVGAELVLSRRQYRFIIRLFTYALTPGRLSDNEFRVFLGMYRADAQTLLDELVAAEQQAESRGKD